VSLKNIELLGILNSAVVKEFEMIPRTTKEVQLIIDSNGGITRHCRSVLSAIHQLKSYHVVTSALVIGKAHSAAFIILQACDVRRATSGADLMFHPPSILRLGKVGESLLVDERIPNHELHLKFLNELSGRTGLPTIILHEWANQERYFSADEALKYHFIDEIVNRSRYQK